MSEPGKKPESTNEANIEMDANKSAQARSTIIPVVRYGAFLYLTLIAVLVNILLPPWVALVFLGFLMVFLILLLICNRKAEAFPGWFRNVHKSFAARLGENPPEILLVLGIVVLSLITNLFLSGANYRPAARTRELLSVLLVIGAFFLNQRKQPYEFGKRSFWDFFKKGKEASKVEVREMTAIEEEELEQLDRTRSPASKSSVLRADSSRKLWEERQRQRWEEWIVEEVDRLDGETKDD